MSGACRSGRDRPMLGGSDLSTSPPTSHRPTSTSSATARVIGLTAPRRLLRRLRVRAMPRFYPDRAFLASDARGVPDGLDLQELGDPVGVLALGIVEPVLGRQPDRRGAPG